MGSAACSGSAAAAPAVLGYLALGSALVIFGSWFAGGWGTEKDAAAFAPFVLFFGGFGQLAAALWSFRARAAVGAVLHGSWAAFWLGIALIQLLGAAHAISVPARGAEWQSLGQWLIYMAVISWTTALAALRRSPVGALAQAVLGTGAALAAVGLIEGAAGWQHVGGWLFVAAGALSYYLAAGIMIDVVVGASVLPLARSIPAGRRRARGCSCSAPASPGTRVRPSCSSTRGGASCCRSARSPA
jgi:succinate-acetate transporter protein